MLDQYHAWYPIVGPYDPCIPMLPKRYVTPPNVYISYQPSAHPQFPLHLALHAGTLWPYLYSPYESGILKSRREEG